MRMPLPKLRAVARSALLVATACIVVLGESGAQAVFAQTCSKGISNLDCQSVLNDTTDYVPNVCGQNAGSSITIEGPDNIAKAMKLFTEQGLTVQQAAAIIGNLEQESNDNLNPTALNPQSGAYGIAQWLGGRLDTLKKLPNYDKFDVQLTYLWTVDIPTQEKTYHGLSDIKKDTKLEDMVFDWENDFERAGESRGSPEIQKRIEKAAKVVADYAGQAQNPIANGGGTSGCAAAAGGGGGGVAGSGFLGDPGPAAVWAAQPFGDGPQCTGYVRVELTKHSKPYIAAGAPGLPDGGIVASRLGSLLHIAVNTTPAVHAVFSMPINASGHTGIVSEVTLNDDGSLKSFTVEEYNWVPNAYGKRTLDAAYIKQHNMTFAHTEVGWQ